jgi:hypothetical protein
MKKKLLLVLLAFVGLAVVGLGLLVARLDMLLKKGVETVGPQLTEVDVRLDGVKLSLLGGSGQLKGLRLGNPPGYKSESAVRLGELSLSLVPKSVFADKIHIRSIALLAPEITLEGGLKDNNLTKILANVQKHSGPASTNQAESTGAQKKLQVDSIVVRGAKVTARLDVLGGQPLSYTLPDLEIVNLGQGPEGITGAELSQRVLDLLFNRALTSMADQRSELGRQAVDAAAQRAQDALKDPAKALQGVSDLLKKKP